MRQFTSLFGGAFPSSFAGAFAFLMLIREGAEAVMFLGAVNLTTDAMLAFIGTVLCLSGSVAFGVMFVKGSLKVDLRRFFAVTEWVLAIFVVHSLGNVQWLIELKNRRRAAGGIR